jgi:hypothetical protein
MVKKNKTILEPAALNEAVIPFPEIRAIEQGA